MEGDWAAGLTGEDWDSNLETETAPIAGSAFSSQSYLAGSASGSGNNSNISSHQLSSNKMPSREVFMGLPPMGTGTSVASAAGASASAPTTAPRPVIQQPLRKSCEFCRLRKKKCDGDGLNPCSLCVSRGLERCVYTERISSAPKNPARSTKRSKNKQGLGKGKETPPSSSRVSTGSVPEASRGEGSQLVPLKRCRMSASPATGLVGMQENVYLSDYFDCMGLLPLTSEKDVRQAMVSVMVAALSPDQRDSHTRVHHRPPLGIPEEADSERGIVSYGMPARVNVQALTCSLWCAVALGALVRGWPTSSVTRYVELARESLTRCFDDASVDTLRAYVLMAFLHNFLGDESRRKFQKYLMFAHGIARALPPEDVPSEVLDLLSAVDSAALFSGVAPTVDELEAFCKPTDGEMKVPAPTASRKLDFCRFLLQADHRLDQAFYKDMVAQGVLGHTKGPASSMKNPLNPQQQQVGADRVDNDEDVQDGGGHRFGERGSRDSMDGVFQERPHSGGVGRGAEDNRRMPEGSSGRRVPGGSGGSEVRLALKVDEGKDSEPPPPGENTYNTVMEEMAEMRRLEQEGKWPDTQVGIGGFLYNMRLAFQAFMVQERPYGFKALNVTLKILVQNPGLLRFSSWLHMTHCALGLFAELETGERYTELRHLYNRMKPAGFDVAPPYEEFRGMDDICHHIFCRSCLSKQWVKEDTTVSFYCERPKAPGAASAETANLAPAVSSSGGAPPASVEIGSSYGGQAGVAPAELSVAAATAAATGQIGIPRVVIDDIPEESGPVHTSNRGTQTQRYGSGGNLSDGLRSSLSVGQSLLPSGQERAWPHNDGDGGGGVPVHQMPEASAFPRSTATAEEDEVRRKGTREDHRLGSDLGAHSAAGPHPSTLPIADTREELVAGSLGSGGNDCGDPVSFDAPGCLLLEDVLLGDESAEDEMWALGADAMGFGPSHS